MPPPAVPGHLRPLTSLQQMRRVWLPLLALATAMALIWFTDLASPLHRYGLLGILLVLLPVLLVLAPLKTFRRQRAVKSIENGVRRLQAGDLAGAAQDFEEAARKDVGPLRALAVHHLALARTLQGELEGAAQLWEAVDASRQLYNAPVLQEAIQDEVALCRALLGQLPEAKVALARGAARRQRSPGNLAVLPEAVILLRSGHPAAAAKLLETRWREVEAPGGAYTRMARLVRALALEGLEDGRHRASVADAIAGARPVAPEDLAPLCARWPEMESFLRGKGLWPANRPSVQEH